ncbi:MAG TPA: S9 family peptidase, partial [Candidatus Bathyarchaeia archaeon]|nr:S9 family peptidase [Candidatus Bathyarchaeia archaeon]
MRKIAPYGSWKSPITSDMLASAYVGLGEVQLDQGIPYWNELHPTEGGRCVVSRIGADGNLQEVIPPGFNSRTRVHEYGGGSYLVDRGTVYFSNFSDHQLYRQV